MTYYCIRVVDGRHVVGITTDGRDFTPIPRAAFDSPRDAVAYADMRQSAISPLRTSRSGQLGDAVNEASDASDASAPLSRPSPPVAASAVHPPG